MIRFIGKRDGKVVFDKTANPVVSAMDLDEWGVYRVQEGIFDSFSLFVDGELYSEYEN